MYANNWRESDPAPVMLGHFPDPKEQLYIFQTKEKSRSMRPGCRFNVKRAVSPENDKLIAADMGFKEVPKFN